MRKLIVSIHSTANNIVTGSPAGDETDFMQWAQPGIDDSLDTFLTYLDNVDTIVLAAAPIKIWCVSGQPSKTGPTFLRSRSASVRGSTQPRSLW